MFPDSRPLPHEDPLQEQLRRNTELRRVFTGENPNVGMALAPAASQAYDWEQPASIERPLGNPLNLSAVATRSCTSCGSAVAGRFCAECGTQLAQTPDPIEQYLNLSDEFPAKKRADLADRGEAQPDGSFPIRNVEDLRRAIQAFGRAGDKAATKAWIIKRAKALRSEGLIPDDWSSTDLSQEHGASVFQLDLAGEFRDGLLWKVLCKTGTLALSPGPGQVDVEQPLRLTSQMFSAVKRAFDERAYEHVVIPTTHDGVYDVMKNTGEVKDLDILSKTEALADVRLSQAAKRQIRSDSDDTLYMLGGLFFTEPDVREKAERGSILNCSVGLKFNVRPNKFSGKLYPVAMEHVALTNQPWVYGMPAFGGADLSAEETEAMPWDGVFLSVEQEDATVDAVAELDRELQSILNGVEDRSTDEDPPRDITTGLSEDDNAGELADRTGEPGESTDMELEQLLAQQQADIEASQARQRDLEDQLALAQARLGEQGRVLHIRQVGERIASYEGKIHPAVLVRAQSIMLADYSETETAAGLNLSVTGADNRPLELSSPTEIVEHLLAAIPPIADGPEIGRIQAGIALSQKRDEDGPSTSEQADAIERRMHPDRFDADGRRIPVGKR